MTKLVKREHDRARNRWLSPFFDDFFNMPYYSQLPDTMMPRTNIRDTEDHLELSFELPGMKKEDISVTVENNILTVHGERNMEYDEEDEGWVRREMSSGAFHRQFTLPTNVKKDSIEAEYKDGILRIRLTKTEESKPKQIEVKVS